VVELVRPAVVRVVVPWVGVVRHLGWWAGKRNLVCVVPGDWGTVPYVVVISVWVWLGSLCHLIVVV
jgi:hypothetical protein